MSVFGTCSFRHESASIAGQQEVIYPVVCHLRIITEAGGFDAAELTQAVAAYRVIEPLIVSRDSTAGRYRAYSLSVEVRNRQELDALDAAIKRVPGVRMVL